jgi:hypothetical protein
MFVYNHEVPYNGPRDFQAIVEFGRKFKASRLIDFKHLGDWYNYDDRLTPQSPIIIAFGDHVERAELNLACIIFDRIPCGASNSKPLADRLGVPYPSYVVVKKFPGEPETAVSSLVPASEDVTIPALIDFLRRESFPAVVELNGENNDILFSPDRPGFKHHFIFPVDFDTTEGATLLTVARELAPTFFGKCLFAFIDLSSKSRYVTNLLLDLEIDKSDPPIVLSVRSIDGELIHYRMETDHWILQENELKDAVRKWVVSVLKGDIEPVKRVGGHNADNDGSKVTDNNEEQRENKNEL